MSTHISHVFLAIAILAIVSVGVASAQENGMQVDINGQPQPLTSNNINVFTVPSGTQISGIAPSQVHSNLENFYIKQVDGEFQFFGMTSKVQTSLSDGHQTIVFAVQPASPSFGLSTVDELLVAIAMGVGVLCIIFWRSRR